ncbi:sensor histidine kinase [Staphylococcus capitis]|uniref:sensor histidine kinase n=1 Tax=Staphylococcus capitis TaxID=29388 RepID=UPI001D14126D|nr:HAMP domain-containing sensor histidine kinase [Staphylococcus capitis]MCC3755808.1 HAMP domain-containing histidine kinase [Staphylococcus capitis]MDH8729451.1 HAMP domain-containing sensor histidine kinase [Staphylococcus capitis]MDH8921635.1 HAMP domain-containing sensor histidine kinase [Staphylococcus capitis]MDH8942838.1 HAMP domain-containing sensor histidine kinase [Staphylococcus capitis]MDH9592504.1 HAMP domain-containing sensor histidine kinase [Staphylococcus capitis]
MFKTLYSRIAIYTITVILFSAFISFVLTNIYYHFNLKASNDAKIMKTLKEARNYENAQNTQSLSSYFKHLGDMNYQILTVDNRGTKHFYGEPFRRDTLPQSAIQSVMNGKNYHGIKNKPFELFVTGFFDNETDNTVGLRFKSNDKPVAVFMRPDIGETFSEFRIFLAVLLGLLLVISISLVIASTYSIIKPVSALKSATHRLMKGDFQTPINQTRQDEIGTLQSRFDTMRKRLGQVDEMRQHFVQNVSHEIKTPLTHIQSILTQLQLSKSKEERQMYVNELFNITTQVSDLTQELLLLSELDNAEHLTLDKRIHLNDLIKDIVRHEQFHIEEKDLVIMTELNEVYFLGNERLIHQALSNLIINAIKYTPQYGLIQIHLSIEASNIIFTIENEGTVRDKDMSHIFERFYKLNNDQSSNGLGLAITKSIVELHNGTISVQSNDATIFTIQLPIKNTV